MPTTTGEPGTEPAGLDLPQLLKQAASLHQNGNIAAAEQFYLQILAARSDHFDALHLLGLVRHQQGRDSESLALIDAALTQRPNSHEALSNRAVILAKLKRPAEALVTYDRAIAVNPHNAEAHYGRGNTLREFGRHAEAAASYDRALAIKPDYPYAHHNRGNALRDLNRHAEALASYDDAIAVDAKYAGAWNGRGVCLQHLGRHDEAIASYDKALAIAPQFAEAHHNRGLAYLLKGDFAAGWPECEWRWGTAQLGKQHFPFPVWLGAEPLAGRKILLHAEQGLGDVIMFMRYVPRVVALGARVALALPPPLIPLFSGIDGVQWIIRPGETLPEMELQCPLMSLPLAFKTSLATMPAEVPYVVPSQDLVAKWAKILGRADRLRVGLVWSGSPQHLNDRNRSIPLDKFGPIISQRAVEFVALQPDVRPHDADVLRRHPHIRHFGQDFANGAAILSLLDLVISVDTAWAHLAGAMAKPVWIPLPAFPDWRWLLEREDSPWYPTARLFRQASPARWDDVIERMARELAARAARQ
jgi:tetratricopeptide (TPR) repeat protein